MTDNMLKCCENTLNDKTEWDKVTCKNVTVSYNFSQPTDFKITQSNKVLHHIWLKKHHKDGSLDTLNSSVKYNTEIQVQLQLVRW